MTEAGIFDSFTKFRHSETRPIPHRHLRLIARGVKLLKRETAICI